MGLLGDALRRLIGDDEDEDFTLDSVCVEVKVTACGGNSGYSDLMNEMVPEPGPLTWRDVGGPHSELWDGSMRDIFEPGWDDDFPS
ncbi:hypothetical protein ACM64Y_01775 [Novispirillum sp. DQ9]|uniref:hypothetical protein n=1 Tax=Novispirillum sp. DQ9 TaxID=3398612 RepID=UPI003C7E8E31